MDSQEKPDSISLLNTLSVAQVERLPKAKIQDVAWIAGHWRANAFGGLAEEIWSPPLGGTMMGMYRLLKEDLVSFYELMAIAEVEGGLTLYLKHFNPDLVGWEERDQAVGKPLVKIGAGAAYFDGLTFRWQDENTMSVFLRMRTKDGRMREETFVYERQIQR